MNKVKKETLAIAILLENPGLSNTEIARRVPCARNSLNRMRKFMRFRDAMVEDARSRIPKGAQVRSKDNPAGPAGIEAWRNDEPDCDREERDT